MTEKQRNLIATLTRERVLPIVTSTTDADLKRKLEYIQQINRGEVDPVAKVASKVIEWLLLQPKLPRTHKPRNVSTQPVPVTPFTPAPQPAFAKGGIATLTATGLTGKGVVVTGKIPNHDRHSAEVMLASAGAHIQKAVTRNTDILVCGHDVGRVKTDKAKALGVQIISWADAEALIQDPGAAVQGYTTAPTPAVRNAAVQPQEGYRQIQPMLCKNEDPVLATASNAYLGYIWEVKWDGYRCVATVLANGSVILASRSGKDLGRFENIATELEHPAIQPGIYDGEIVALDEQGRSQFAELHGGQESRAKLVLFDMLADRNGSLMQLTLGDRRERLHSALANAPKVYVTESPIFEDGAALLAYASENELEGIVGKAVTSKYIEGARNGNWIKLKLRLEQEFVVVGYTEGQGNRAGTAGALLLAVNHDTTPSGVLTPQWVFCGSAGTGGTYDDFNEIVGRTTALGGNYTLPINHDLTKAELAQVTWVQPEVVVKVKFQRWTKDGKLWHPSIQGIDEEREPSTVIKDT